MTSLCAHCGEALEFHRVTFGNICPISDGHGRRISWHPTNRFTPRSEEHLAGDGLHREESDLTGKGEVVQPVGLFTSPAANPRSEEQVMSDDDCKCGGWLDGIHSDNCPFKSPATVQPEPQPELISALVDAFLAWPLPASVYCDECVRISGYKHHRSGTNLLAADEARQMFEYCLAKAPAFKEPAKQPANTAEAKWTELHAEVRFLREEVAQLRSELAMHKRSNPMRRIR